MTMNTSAPEANDVFSLSDHLLAERLQFVKEVCLVSPLLNKLNERHIDWLRKLGQRLALPSQI